MKRFSVLLLLLLTVATLNAQGLEFEDERYEQLPQLPQIEGAKDIALPQAVDLSPYCPQVRNQGDAFSCVGWAVGYGALTIQRAIDHQWAEPQQITENAYSALYIYNQIGSGDCRQGARISDALELLSTRGDCPAREFDFELDNCQKRPSPELIRRARRDTIADYMTLFGLDAPPDEKARQVRMALAQNYPVIVGMAVLRNFYQLRDARYWWPDIGDTTPAGGHALVVVGYDDPSSSFLLFNSWGESWGDQGFIRIKYDAFSQYCKYAFIMQTTGAALPDFENAPAIEARPLATFGGKAAFRYLDNTNGNPFFRTAPVKGEKGEYQTFREDWPVGQYFQIEASVAESGLYFYAFSVDALNNVNIHWPRSESLNARFTGLSESAFVIDPGIRIVIPGPNKALTLAHPGKDVVYLLASRRKIEGLRFITEKMRYVRGNYRERLEQIMGWRLAPAADVEYDPYALNFRVTTRSKGYIVPMILEVQAK